MTDLGLYNAVDRYFNFLVSDKGYRYAETSPDRVRFESPSVFIEIAFDGDRSYELSLLIGRKDTDILPFTLGEVLQMRNACEANPFMLVQVDSEQSLDLWVAKFAEKLRLYGEDFIKGSENDFRELAEQRHKHIESYALERDMKVAVSRAESAWREKDYESVVNLLGPFRSFLSPAEAKKLEYSERKLD